MADTTTTTETTMTDRVRAAAEKLVQLLDDAAKTPGAPSDDECIAGAEALDNLRAALDQPEPEGPTVMEIIELADEIEAAELGQVDLVRAALTRWSRPTPQPQGEVAELLADLETAAAVTSSMNLHEDAAAIRRAADLLPRLALQPVDGEVAELAAKLRRLAPQNPMGIADPTILRAADLLEHLSPPQPIPVSERLPGPGDCDAEGRCWIHQPCKACPESPAWELMSAKYAIADYGVVCWLPAHALPLPSSGEVGP